MAVWVSDNAPDLTGSTAGYTRCTADFFNDGGFKVLSPDCIGRYLILKRDGGGMSGDNVLNINEVRIYTVPNLLTEASIVQAPEPKDPLFKADNLI